MSNSRRFRPVVGPVSLLLRLPRMGDSIQNIARAHKAVISSCGFVWLRINCKKPSEQSLKYLQDSGDFLYLAQMQQDGPAVYQGKLAGVATTLPPSEERLIPSYYAERNLFGNVGFWVKLSSLDEASSKDLDKLYVARTGTKVTNLFRSMVSLAIVSTEPPSPTMPVVPRDAFARSLLRKVTRDEY